MTITVRNFARSKSGVFISVYDNNTEYTIETIQLNSYSVHSSITLEKREPFEDEEFSSIFPDQQDKVSIKLPDGSKEKNIALGIKENEPFYGYWPVSFPCFEAKVVPNS